MISVVHVLTQLIYKSSLCKCHFFYFYLYCAASTHLFAVPKQWDPITKMFFIKVIPLAFSPTFISTQNVICQKFTRLVSFCRHGHSWARADVVQSWWSGTDKRNYFTNTFACNQQKKSDFEQPFFLLFHPSIQGNASFSRQLHFLQQLLSVVPGCKESCSTRTDAELLLNELFSAENQNLLTQMLQPSPDPWPSHMKYVGCDCVPLIVLLWWIKTYIYVC